MNKANKRGITLIELICVLAVVAILGPLIGGFITTAGAQYTNAALHTRAKSNVIMLQQVCESDLRLATAATITDVDSPPPAGTTSIHMISGNHYNGYFYAGLLSETGAPY
ncbi:MAG: type II secretion system protein, partial [Ruthenibacterium sp.]